MIILPAFFLSVLACAQNADKGYVVRVDSQSVWLDLTAADGATAGRPFEIYTEGSELKHPVTGESLGRVRSVAGTGSITDVSDKFSSGRLAGSWAEVKAGQRARWTAPAATRTVDSGRLPKTSGATLNFAVNAMAVGDFDGAGRPQIVLASDNSVKLYAYPALDAKPLVEATLPGTGLRIVGLDALDMDGDKRAELFVSVYDDAFKRFETRVLKLETGKWLKVAELPFLTRGYQDAQGARVLATQQVLDDASFPFGAIYPIAYQDGKYSQGRPALGFRRVDWLYGFTTAQLGSAEPAVLYLTSVHALRVQFGKKWWRTADDDYGQTPLRVRWREKMLEFNPPMAATYGTSGFEALYAVRNMAALGGLASPFGIFNRAELVRKHWNGLGLETAWKAELPGCAQGLAVVEAGGGKKEIAVAVRGSAGESSIWTFDP